MSHSDENLSAQQSLDLITTMIRQAQGKVSGNSFYFILWGWCIAIANFGMYGLITFTEYPYPDAVWLIIIPAWALSFWYGRRNSRQQGASTHLDKINMWLWISMGLTILPVCVFGGKLDWNINPVILLMSAVPTFVAGIIVRFKPLLVGGVCFWIGGIIGFMMPTTDQYLVGGITVVLGYLVPGYLLKNLNEK